MDDDDDWQDMPVLQSTNKTNKQEIERQWRQAREENGEDPDERPEGDNEDSSGRSDSDDDRPQRRRAAGKKSGQLRNGVKSRKPAVPMASTSQISPLTPKTPNAPSNATGNLIDFGDEGTDWREKGQLDEQDYTRLELDEDPEEDEIHTRTQHLFDDDKGMTPLSQMQTTKSMLSDPQRIAYVGLCRLVTREMAMAFKGLKELEPATDSLANWGSKVMGRLYQHMEIDPAEQKMIELLAEHGVTAADLVPSLIATHTMANPEYDPEAEREAIEEAAREAEEAAEQKARDAEEAREQAIRDAEAEEIKARWSRPSAEEDDLARQAEDLALGQDSEEIVEGKSVPKPETNGMSEEKEVDIGQVDSSDDEEPPQYDALPKTPRKSRPSSTPMSPNTPRGAETPRTPKAALGAVGEDDEKVDSENPKTPNLVKALPNTLPGVTTNLTAADKTVTLDIRWTILCDLFLALVADSVYDARSRVLLCKIAESLDLSWMDVVRFERRLTDALEIQEGIKDRDQSSAIDVRAKADKRKRYMLMGLATVGGGLVLGLSAGLLAPAIAGGLAGALATVGVSGGGAFLGGVGGAAVITTGGVITGSSIGGRGMARRTKAVSKFELHPVHNNKRLNLIVSIPGFMNGPQDDVRLPFSTMDPIMGDLFSVLWEPETLGQTGNALKILGSEVLSSVGQQVLQYTLLGAMVSALQWPILLTKLGYLIDNPWSNALDRARQAGEVMATILINRGLGVRPVTLIGFSLGARVVFYTLVALAKKKAFGIVQEAYLMGATVTASRKMWREVRGVVSGRFVNCYARNDWILGYLFRATTGGLSTVAGLRPVEFVPELENIDITDLLAGHMTYRSLMPVILKSIGFRVTADSFDEPEGLEAPDREVVTTEQELARLEAQKKASWLSRWKKDKSNGPTPDISRQSSSSGQAAADARKAYDEYTEDTPPREEADIGVVESEKETAASQASQPTSPGAPKQATSPVEAKAASVKPEADAASKDVGVGFDLEQIRAEIEKDESAEQLPIIEPPRPDTAPERRSMEAAIASTSSIAPAPKSKSIFSKMMRSKPDLVRTGSAPTPVVISPHQRELDERERAEAENEARQRQLEEQEAREEEAFRKGLPVSQVYPSAVENPFASTSSSSLPYAGSNNNDFSSSFNFSSSIPPTDSAQLSFGGDDGQISYGTSGAANNAWGDPWQSSTAAQTWSSSPRW